MIRDDKRAALIGMTRAEAREVLGGTPSTIGTNVGKLGLGIRGGVVYDATAERAARDAEIETRRVSRDPCTRCGTRTDLASPGCPHHPIPAHLPAGQLGGGSDHHGRAPAALSEAA